MRAAPGAVDHVTISGRELSYTTVAGEKPLGICGSGIIDLLAQMRLNGWLNIAGELQPGASERIVELEDGQYAVEYATARESADGRPRHFTQTDIRQYLDTKAAAYTMMECLLEYAPADTDRIQNLYLSGAFAAHSAVESAVTVGMYPDLPRDRYHILANTSLEGARILLLDRSRLEEARELADKLYCVQLASVPDFLVRMQAAKFVPHTDMDRYPSVRSTLEAKGF